MPNLCRGLNESLDPSIRRRRWIMPILSFFLSCFHSYFLSTVHPSHRQRKICGSWCGPCKASKPRLMELAKEQAGSSGVQIGYALEEDLEDFLDVFVVIKSFPTYIFFREGQEIARVEGVNFDSLTKMINDNKQQS